MLILFLTYKVRSKLGTRGQDGRVLGITLRKCLGEHQALGKHSFTHSLTRSPKEELLRTFCWGPHPEAPSILHEQSQAGCSSDRGGWELYPVNAGNEECEEWVFDR